MLTLVLVCCRNYNGRKPEVLVISHEHDPRAESALLAAKNRRDASVQSHRKSVGAHARGGRSNARSGGSQQSNMQQSKNQAALQRQATITRRDSGDSNSGPRNSHKQGAKSMSSMKVDVNAARSSSPSVNRRAIRNKEKKANASKDMNGKTSSTGKLVPLPEHVLQKRKKDNPREDPQPGVDVDYG